MGGRRKPQREKAQQQDGGGSQGQRRAADRALGESSGSGIRTAVQQKEAAAEAESATGNRESGEAPGARPHALGEGEVRSGARVSSLLSPRGREVVLLIAILLLASVLAVMLFDPKPSVGGDNAHYLLLAKALAIGRGYRSIESPGDPPHTLYPFGYPLLLTPLAYLIPKSILPAKILSLVLFVGSLLLVYALFRSRVGAGLTLSVLALLAVSPIMLEFSHWALSEIPFLFFSLVTIVLLSAAEHQGRASDWWFALGSLSLVYTCYIRAVGIALILAVLLRLTVGRQFRRLLLLGLIVILLLTPWLIRNARLPVHIGDPSGASYVAYIMMVSKFDPEAGRLTLGEYVARVLRVVGAYWKRVFPPLILPAFWSSASAFELPSTVRVVVWPLVALLILCGLVMRFSRGAALFDLYLVFYLLILWAWAGTNIAAGARYLLPVLPFVVLCFVQGSDELLKWGLPRRSVALGVFLVLTLVGTGVVGLLPGISVNLSNFTAYMEGDFLAGYPDAWANFFSVAIFAGEKLPGGAVVMTRKPGLFYLYSNCKSVIYPFTRDADEFYQALAEEGVDFVLIDAFRWTKTTSAYLIPAVMSRLDRFRVICVTVPPKTYLLQVLGDPREWSKEETDESDGG